MSELANFILQRFVPGVPRLRSSGRDGLVLRDPESFELLRGSAGCVFGHTNSDDAILFVTLESSF